MKIKKIFLLASSLLITSATLVACAKKSTSKTYVMEAEYIDLDDVQGSGISSDQGGVQMIYGNGTQEEKNAGWSNGYFVGFTYAPNLKLDFVFNSSKRATSTIVLRLGSELGDLNLDPSIFEVQLNEDVIPYSSLTVNNSADYANMKFYDKTLSTNVRLAQGQNVLSLIILPNSLKPGGTSGGPTVDCVKITTKAKLTWEEKKDNITRRDGGDI